MVEAKRGLIVHLSHWAAQKYHGSTIYGVSKAATDKMGADMAAELVDHGVVVVTLYPGLVRTEATIVPKSAPVIRPVASVPSAYPDAITATKIQN